MIYPTQATRHNLAHALSFGELASPIANWDYPMFDANGLQTDQFRNGVRRNLDAFSASNDYLLLVGDPIVIGLCVAHILNTHGRVRVLKWDNQARTYLPATLTK